MGDNINTADFSHSSQYKEYIIATLLQLGVYKRDGKQLYELSFSELEETYINELDRLDVCKI
ncbi:Fur-regulated basic protein FbpA [Fictibacillus nanhaiensis]|uniref:Fur-regulated basic protein FbpA n=1 Tax=Fictibacillus nanhaiensis TaxID=742169 RepID=UPI002E214789|nr:Fur-regulated basic protein FbpA [Fictibacillus nanhaiensis]